MILADSLYQLCAGLASQFQLATPEVLSEPAGLPVPGQLVLAEFRARPYVGLSVAYERLRHVHTTLLRLDADAERKLVHFPESYRLLGTPDEYITRRQPVLGEFAVACRTRNLLLLATLLERNTPLAAARKAVREYRVELSGLLDH